ncbi:GTPase family protein [Methylocystis heyeri]|uniref:GTPase family protein n=1 Tax=Methylocystis heyeri TaxID=391905 RepID=UPI001134144F|nr:GTPase domain-containing protein [Methylocystis heyeri]
MLEALWKRLNGWRLTRFWEAVGRTAAAADEEDAEKTQSSAAATAPIIWLLGKTGSGKSSIASALTGDPKATIGEGYKPCTARSAIYDWPREAPILRFLDTRGLGEADYDPAEDIAYAEAQTHILLVAAKISDPSQGEVVSVVEKIRLKHPEWPIVVAQTTLHALYPRGETHPPTYPYAGTDADDRNIALPTDLRRALRYQRELFARIAGRAPIFVPLDFTLPEDGHVPIGFGDETLKAALIKTGADVLRKIEENFAEEANDEIARQAHPFILGYAAAAGASGAVPIPIVGIGALASSVGLMLHALASRYEMDWNRMRISQFAGAIGLGAAGGFAFRYGLGELVKLIPIQGTIAGGALNAAGASALVYAIGIAACVYLGEIRKGQIVSSEKIRRAFEDAFARSQAKKPKADRS